MSNVAPPLTTGRVLANAGLVFAGGALGVGLRVLLLEAKPSNSFWTLLIINTAAAFLLGALVALAARGIASESTRLFLGTGVLGGFSSYSSLIAALEFFRLMFNPTSGPSTELFAIYLVGTVATVVAGPVAAYLGWIAYSGSNSGSSNRRADETE